MNQNLALFTDAPNPVDAIENSLALLEVVRENFSVEDSHHGIWLTLGVVGDSVRAAVARMKPAT
jgi:hypothetical protein